MVALHILVGLFAIIPIVFFFYLLGRFFVFGIIGRWVGIEFNSSDWNDHITAGFMGFALIALPLSFGMILYFLGCGVMQLFS
jgi:hypothetical protein